MKCVRDAGGKALAFGLCAALLLGVSTQAGAQAVGEPIALAPVEADASLESLGRGFDLWLESALREAGRPPLVLATPGLAGLEGAAKGGHDQALVARLREHEGRVELLLTLYEPASGARIASGRGEASLDEIGAACLAALKDVSAALGIATEGVIPPRVGELASVTRALTRWQQGRLHEAWLAIDGRMSPLALSTRQGILSEARRSGGDKLERARVLAASGDFAAAWGLLGSRANLDLRKRRPDPSLLLAAAEAQLARQNPRSALRYLEVAVAHAPDSAPVQLALGRAHALQGQPGPARVALERAAELDPENPLPLALLAELDAGNARRAAAHWLEAAGRRAAAFEPDRARQGWQRAAELDPRLAPRAGRQRGALEDRLGRPAEALAAYRVAARAKKPGVEVWVGIGRAQRALGEPDEAEASLRRAVSLAPRHAPALLELGSLLAESERSEEALPLLRSAHEVRPDDARYRLNLARALRLSGAHSDAVEVLLSGGSVEDARLLHELARAQEAAGDLEASQQSLSRAVELEPSDPALREDLAAARGEAGAPADAAGVGELVASGSDSAGDAEEHRAAEVDFDAAIAQFSADLPASATLSVLHLGVREPGDWKTWLRRFSRPREPHAGRLEAGLRDAIDARFSTATMPEVDTSAIAPYVDQLYRFESEESLGADVIAGVNGVLASDAVFVTRLITHPGDHAGVRCPADAYALETRLLRGSDPAYVQILAGSSCVTGGLGAYGRWNLEAFGAYAALLLFVLFPLIRGWGTIVVRIHLPEQTKGFFSIHVTTKPDQVKRTTVDKKTGREKIRAKRRLDFLRRYERHMAGRETHLGWIPARKGDYYVTVGGPLLDAQGEEVIGHFLEEQRIRVRRRGVAELDFDFVRKECAVEIKVLDGGQPAEDVRVAIDGDLSSLRYARDGIAYLYLGVGEYTIRVGSKAAAGEFRVLIEKLDAAVPLHVDFAQCDLVFRNCPAAVEAYLVGDLAAAAEALEGAGDDAAARRLRAEHYEREGRTSEAADEREALGELGQAAELRAGDDLEGSAELFEQAGDSARAGQTYRDAGRFEDAARCFEEAYDYGNALECWREAGDEERELAILEKLGEYIDAAQIARSRGEVDRAIANLQQVDQRHPDYRHTRRLIAEIVSERGDHALAVEKFEEAFEGIGLESASIDSIESYAEVLERAGLNERAITAYETIRRRDVARTDVTTRIESLRAEIERTAAAAAPTDGATATIESRYELLDEVGRGGMGVVYKARDKRLGRIVALKRLPENLREHPSAVALFEREARAAAALNHTNIVTLFDAGQENGTYFITMELLEGRALNEILARHGRLSVRDTARIGIQIAAGLHYAHQQRIVHRDIKTANLFFTRDQVVKIMDFGIAKSLEEVRRSTTVVGGTPYYMAPEQAKGESVDHRADLYAFGVTLFQLGTGSLPFTEGDVAYLHAHEAPPDPREIELAMPAELAELILRLMAKARDERPAHAAEVSETLRGVLSGLT